MVETLEHLRWDDDGVVVDRVRSSLGTLLKQLDQPRVHVSAAAGVITLHGDVSDTAAKVAVERAARQVPGVVAVRSRLRVGLERGDTRPSEGHRGERSELMARLQAAAADCGYTCAAEERFVLRGTLGAFAAALPDPVRRRFLEHLPTDVRRLAEPPHWAGSELRHVGSAQEFTQNVAVTTMTDRAQAARVVRAVLPVLREHAYDDAETVAMVLPEDVRRMWAAPSSRRTSPMPRTVRTGGDPLRSMSVAGSMTREFVRGRPDTSLFDAFELMTRTRVHHLPIVGEDGRCLVLLEIGRVAAHMPEAWVTDGALPAHRVETVVPVSVTPDQRLVDAATAMHRAGADACCVVDVHRRLIGLLTARDLVAALAHAAEAD